MTKEQVNPEWYAIVMLKRGRAQRRADVEYKLSQVALRLRQLKLIAAQLGKEKQ